MKKLKYLESDGEKMANGISYYIAMTAIFLGMFFGGCYILNSIIDPCLEMLESFASNVLRVGIALAKIIVVGVFLIAIYQVFIKGV